MSIRPGLNFTVDELDYIGRPKENRFDCWGTAEIINSYKENISIGQTMESISELGGLHRQLLQDSDFHAAGNVLLKKLSIDEESQKLFFDGRNLPIKLQKILLLLNDKEIEYPNLKRAIRLVEDNKDRLEWIINNWQVFIDDFDNILKEQSISILDIGDINNQKHLTKTGGQARDLYKISEIFYKNNFKESAERRIFYLKIRLRDIQKCHIPQEIEKELSNIRGVYKKDQALLQSWNLDRKREDRKLYLSILYRKKLDLENIRRKIWYSFDRKQKEKIIEEKTNPLRPEWIKYVNPNTMEINSECYLSQDEINSIIKSNKKDPRIFIKERRITQASIWDIERSKALCDLNQTRAQWNKIYTYLWERMTQIIVWKIRSIKTFKEGFELSPYIRKYQYRLNNKMISAAILFKSKKVQTVNGKKLIYMFLSNYKNQLDKKIKKEVINTLNTRKIVNVL
jgi:hypothetical protein